MVTISTEDTIEQTQYKNQFLPQEEFACGVPWTSTAEILFLWIILFQISNSWKQIVLIGVTIQKLQEQ